MDIIMIFLLVFNSIYYTYRRVSHFHFVGCGVEQITSSNRVQHWIAPIVHYVMRGYWWQIVSLQRVQTPFQSDSVVFGQ